MDYLQLYFIGCFFVLALTLLKVLLGYVILWLTNDAIYLKNIKKIQPPNETTFVGSAGKFILVVGIETVLSWINVPIIFWQLTKMIVAPIRFACTYRPEAAKKVLYPLKNNPNLDAETVWSLAMAFSIHFSGRQTDARSLLDELAVIAENRPNFDSVRAVKQLKDLDVVKPETIASVLEVLEGLVNRSA